MCLRILPIQRHVILQRYRDHRNPHSFPTRRSSDLEFYRACKNIGGEFIQISPASRNCINIMEIRKTDNSVNELLDGTSMDNSARSEEHTSELQSRFDLVCRLLLEKKKYKRKNTR